MTSCCLHHVFKSCISKYSPILRSWGLTLGHTSLGKHSSAHNIHVPPHVLPACKIHLSLSQQAKVLNPFRHQSVQNLIELSFKTNVGDIPDLIPPEAKFLSRYKPVKPDKSSASQIQQWDRPRITHFKGEKWERRKESRVQSRSET